MRCPTGADAMRLFSADVTASYARPSAPACRSFPWPASAGMTRHFILSEGHWIADGLDRVSGLKAKVRGSQLPIVLGVPPFGLTIETIPTHLPLPAKSRTGLLDPIEVDKNPERAGDHTYVDSIYREVESAIQQAMDRLAKQRLFPIFG